MPKVKRRLGRARGVRSYPSRAREAAARGRPRSNKDAVFTQVSNLINASSTVSLKSILPLFLSLLPLFKFSLLLARL